MAHINKGDLIEVKNWTPAGWEWTPALAVSDDYTVRVAGDGEFINDWRFVPSVDYVIPTRASSGTSPLTYVKKL